MRDQHEETENGKNQTGPAGDFMADFECTDSAGQEQKHESPGKKNGVDLITHDQEFCGPVSTIDFPASYRDQILL